MPDNKDKIQLIWGIALASFGLGVFFRYHQVLPWIEELTQSSVKLLFIRFCFYLIGTLLIVGGSQKIYRHFRPGEGEEEA